MTRELPLVDIVLFDIDDTLYSTTEFAWTARRNAIAAMIDAGLDIGEEEGLAELMEVVAEFTSNYDDHFGRLLDRLGPRAWEGRNPAVLIAAGVVAYHRTKERGMRLLPDVAAALESLAEAHVRLGVVSAGLHVKQAEKLVRLGALRFFDHQAIFFSDQMGVSKPNPKIYQKAVAALGLEPGRVLYVGDRPTHDIEPAHGAGLHTVHYTGAGGAYAVAEARQGPDHRIDDMEALVRILRTHYRVRA